MKNIISIISLVSIGWFVILWVLWILFFSIWLIIMDWEMFFSWIKYLLWSVVCFFGILLAIYLDK
jgi:hypothetical protein